MNTIIEYIVSINGECHSTHSDLRKARTVYRSLINIGEVEGRESIIEVVRKKVSFKSLNKHELGESVLNTEEFGENFDAINS